MIGGRFLLGASIKGLVASALLYSVVPAAATVLPTIVLLLALAFTMVFLFGLIDAMVNGLKPRCFLESLATGAAFTAIGYMAGLTRNVLARSILAILQLGALSTLLGALF